MVEIGERLKTLRDGVKLSQVQVAEFVDMKQSSINRYEKGLSEAPYRVLLWYANYFDVSMDYIFGRCEQPQGKLYDYQPKAFDKEMKQFVEMCFDPKSPMNDKLKQAVMRLMEEGKQS